MIIGKAIQANPMFSEKKRLMLAAEATLQERMVQATPIETHLHKLDSECGAPAADSSVSVVCSDVTSLVKVLPMSAISQHVDDVLEKVLAHLERSLHEADLPPARLGDLRACCVCAVEAYPQNKRVNAITFLCAERES